MATDLEDEVRDEPETASDLPTLDAREIEHELLAKIRGQEAIVVQAELELNLAKGHVKACRECFDVEVSKLRGLIRGSREEHPLFDAAPETGSSGPVSADAWREVEIATLEIPAALATRLYEAEIETIGDLVDYQSAGHQLVDIKGVGQAKGDKIADALEAFWRSHPEYAQGGD